MSMSTVEILSKSRLMAESIKEAIARDTQSNPRRMAVSEHRAWLCAALKSLEDLRDAMRNAASIENENREIFR